MAIQLQLQRPNLDSASQFLHQFHPNHHPDNYSLLLSQHYWTRLSDPDHTASSIPEMPTDQIDPFIRLQSERLRLLLQQKRNLQIGVLLNQIETRTRVLFQHKDEEIARANKRRMELQQLLTRLEMENRERQRAVQENQAMVASLSHALDQIRERLSSCANDAESNNNYKGGEGQEDAIDCGTKKQSRKRMICRICNSRISCVLLLPCRHLCSCKPCESALDFCPVCNTTKKASIEAAIF